MRPIGLYGHGGAPFARLVITHDILVSFTWDEEWRNNTRELMRWRR